jgi:hypothetical protein
MNGDMVWEPDPQLFAIFVARGGRGTGCERLAAASPGALQVTRLLFTDDTNIPSYVQVVVAAAAIRRHVAK